MKDNIHKGHRQRVKTRFIHEGLDNFEDHEVLELLLYYCCPMVDTNEKAHKMIAEFGTLSNLFDAHTLEIVNRCGVTENIAVLVSLIPSLSKRYMKGKWDKKEILDSSAKAGEFAKYLFVGAIYECFYVLCLDSQRKLNYASLISKGTINEAPIYTRQIVEVCLKYRAASVVLTHNHPGGTLAASRDDVEATKKIVNALEAIDVDVLDHIIVANDKYLSFAEKRLLRMYY